MNICKVIAPLLIAAVASSCASHRPSSECRMLEQVDTIWVGHDGSSFSLDKTIQIPEEWYKRRSRLIISPQLVLADQSVTDYEPVIADASIYTKKLRRKKVLENFQDEFNHTPLLNWSKASGNAFTLSNTYDLPENFSSGHLNAIVTLDGCAECTALDTVLVAYLNKQPQPADTFSLQWIEPQFVVRPKIMHGQGEAMLQFPINSSKIVLEMGRNLQELLKMSKDISPILNDSLMEFNFIRITGVASADGSLAFNTKLAYNRAQSASNWLMENLNLPEKMRKLISVHYKPEGWEPVLLAMQQDNSPYATQVEEVLNKYAGSDDDKQEYYIRRLPCWNVIKNNYLQKDRKVEYTYEYTIRSFTTDEELLRMYEERLEVFNEEEMLRVAELVEPLERKLEIYEQIVERFPESKIGKNNYEVLKHQLKKLGDKQK